MADGFMYGIDAECECECECEGWTRRGLECGVRRGRSPSSRCDSSVKPEYSQASLSRRDGDFTKLVGFDRDSIVSLLTLTLTLVLTLVLTLDWIVCYSAVRCIRILPCVG